MLNYALFNIINWDIVSTFLVFHRLQVKYIWFLRLRKFNNKNRVKCFLEYP